MLEQSKISRKFISSILEISFPVVWKRLQKYDEELKAYGSKVPVAIARKMLRENFSKKYSPKTKVQCFFNFKGGTGKTTITYNIAFLLYLFGYKVLMIDCDAQGHLTKCIIEDYHKINTSLFDVLAKTHSVKDTIINIMPEMDLIPSTVKLSFVESLLVGQVRREEVLKDILEPIKNDYDFILFDVNPSLSTLNRNILIASDRINIISEAQPLSFLGMEMLLQEFNQLAKLSVNSEIDYKVLLNKLEPKIKSNMEVVNALQQNPEIQTRLYDNAIRKCDDFNFSAKNRIPIALITNKLNSNAREDILALGKEMILGSCIELNQNKEVRDAA